MVKFLRFLVVFVLLTAALPVTPATASAPVNGLPPLPPECSFIPKGTFGVPSDYLICVPVGIPWNGDLVVYAHGYVPGVVTPVGIPWAQMFVETTFIPTTITGLGYAFATTSYPVNGLAVLPAIQDLRALVTFTKNQLQVLGVVKNVYLAGVSEGGLITALAIEQYPGEFSGGLALCGPVGNFRKQIDYFGDFRVVFDYFFPGVLPGTAIDVLPELMLNWDTDAVDDYKNRVLGALAADTNKTKQLLNVTNAPIDAANPVVTTGLTVTDLLWYDVFGMPDALATLGGNPYDNRPSRYTGSSDDKQLNKLVARFKDVPAATREVETNYQTTGKLTKPLVTMHTTGDPIIPFWQETLYAAKTLQKKSSSMHVNIPIVRYGHCAFKVNEVLLGFATLNTMVTGTLPAWQK